MTRELPPKRDFQLKKYFGRYVALVFYSIVLLHVWWANVASWWLLLVLKTSDKTDYRTKRRLIGVHLAFDEPSLVGRQIALRSGPKRVSISLR